MERPWATGTRKLGVSREAKKNHEEELERWAGASGALKGSRKGLGGILRD